MINPGELGGRSPRLGNLVQFEVNDCVGEYQRARMFVEENQLLEIAPGKKQLVDFAAPFFGRDGVQVSREVDIHVPGPCSSAYTRRRPGNRFGKSPRPFPNVRIVELVG